MEYISTSALATKLELKSADLFEKLKTHGFIDRKNDKWVLTNLGKQNGGQTRNNPKFGEYIVWPENLILSKQNQRLENEFPILNSIGKFLESSIPSMHSVLEDIGLKEKSKLINATAIGKHFNISSQRFNLLLNELGLIEKTVAGWAITKLGKSIGGRQFEHETSGGTYILWPETILQNKDILAMFHVETTVNTAKAEETQIEAEKQNTDADNDFRKKYKAEYRTKDGHYVRSKAELTIDDSLYLWGIPHAYEKKLPNTEHNVYSDFHIPSGKGRPKAVYIEYWGLENDENYNSRKTKKIGIYNDLGLNLIQLNDADIKNIEDSLQKYLLQHSIKVSLD